MIVLLNLSRRALTSHYAALQFDTAFPGLNQSKQRIGGPEEKANQSQWLVSALGRQNLRDRFTVYHVG